MYILPILSYPILSILTYMVQVSFYRFCLVSRRTKPNLKKLKRIYLGIEIGDRR